MIAAILILAGICANPPLFDDTGPECTPARETVECGCTECFKWDPVFAVPPAPAAEFYRIERTDSANNTLVVGDTTGRNRAAWVDDDGNPHPEVLATMWCVAWDNPMPLEGATYRYTVKGCTTSAGCGGGDIVYYVGAPYRLYP